MPHYKERYITSPVTGEEYDRVDHPTFPVTRAYNSGYYDVPFSEEGVQFSVDDAFTSFVKFDDSPLMHYLDGVIDRLADQALDRLDEKAADMEREFDRQWYAPGGPADMVRTFTRTESIGTV